MSLNPKFIAARDLQEYLVDKTTGLPLANGTLTFYSDTNRTVLKNVYQLSGYPNYTYEPLPNPLSLSAVGTTINESGQYVPIYYYPYLGSPSDDNDTIERYYITINSSNPIIDQFDLEAWPPGIFSTNGEMIGNDILNYIPNGQFRTHYDVQGNIDNNIQFGQITDAITNLAPGGWTFERPNTSTATDIVTFFRYGSYVSNPTSSPRFAVNIACNGANPSDAYKYLAVKFQDVNKFAGTQSFTFTFDAELGASSSFDIQLFIIKNFGTGGAPSPTQIILKDTFTIIAGTQTYNSIFTFGDNIGQGIGDNNDDYVQIALGFPTDQTYAAKFTDFSLVFGNVILTEFPIQTDADTYTRSIFGWIDQTTPDGMDLYLPIIKTKYGTSVDDSQVGQVFATTLDTAGTAELMMTGQQLAVNGYSNDGIPYKRLFNKWINTSTGIPKFGTGLNFITCYINSTNTGLILMTNKLGMQIPAANGIIATPFIFNPICSGNTSYGVTPYFSGDINQLIIICNDRGAVINNDNNTAPITVNILRGGQDASQYQTDGYNNGIKQIYILNITNIPTAGQYFFLNTPIQEYYVWFTVNGTGTNPSPGGIGILVNLINGMTTSDVTKSIFAAINAATASYITTSIGSSIVANSYWTFYANGQLWVVWYSLNGTGSQPSVVNAKYIEVFYQSSSNQNEVNKNTLDAINSQFFYIPDWSGLYLRSTDINNIWDIDNLLHISQNSQNIGMTTGTIEIESIISHYHEANRYQSAPEQDNFLVESLNSGGTITNTAETNNTGGSETRPMSGIINWIVKI